MRGPDGFTDGSKVEAAAGRVCGLVNCHGLDFSCAFQEPRFCTQIYEPGDLCRRFAKCEVKSGKCELVPDAKLDQCVKCFRDCLASGSSTGGASPEVDCDSRCSLVLGESSQ